MLSAGSDGHGVVADRDFLTQVRRDESRAVLELVGGSREHDLARDHHARAGAEPQRERGVLLDEQDRGALRDLGERGEEASW